jgi:AcrR family transcriptional regulator
MSPELEGNPMTRIDPERRAQIGRDRRARSRARLIEAARLLFAARPIDTVTVDELTKAAPTAKGAFYLHFRNLGELRAAVADELARELQAMLEPHRAALADPFERIAAGCAAFIQQAVRDPAWGGLMARVIWSFPAVARTARERLGEDLREATAQGRLAPISQGAGFDIIAGVLVQAMRSASEKRLADSDVSSIVGGILRALGLPAAETRQIVRRISERPGAKQEADRPSMPAGISTNPVNSRGI